MSADRLTSQLVEVADVVGDLGRNIAAAQKLLNKDYVDSLQALMRMAADHLDADTPADDRAEALVSLLRSLAPSRYQYTETTVEFAADLSETRQRSTRIGGGATFRMLQVNAAMAMGYGQAFRSAARITATIHAAPDAQLASRLLDRAGTGAPGRGLISHGQPNTRRGDVDPSRTPPALDQEPCGFRGDGRERPLASSRNDRGRSRPVGRACSRCNGAQPDR